MDEFASNVVAGVIANTITQAAAALFNRESRNLDPQPYAASTRIPLSDLLSRATAKFGKTQVLSDATKTERFREFCASPELESLLRQVLSNSLSDPARKMERQADLEFAFRTTLSLYLKINPSEIPAEASELFTGLLKACDDILQRAIEKGALTAHEAKSAARFNVLAAEIKNLTRNIELLNHHRELDLEAIEHFESQYRKQVQIRHGTITPPHFDAAIRLPIDSIYVAPNFIDQRATRERRVQEETISLHQLLERVQRTVILGNPGAGKSTLANKIAHDMSVENSGRVVARRSLSVLLIILRDYGVERKSRKCTILDYAELNCRTQYQLNPPTRALEYLLLSGRAAVIFDGLDELIETAYRQEISADIESFASLYPSVPIIVTSREVGYEQAPLDSRVFTPYTLAPFKEEQVEAYVTKWFCSDTELTAAQQSQKTRNFLSESQAVSDLRSNPLMLALMCNIYRGENYIPKNRPEVYEKCAVMLFERWDKGRGIMVPLPIEAHVRPAMMHLAHWIYSEAKLQAGVTERDLIKKAATYLCDRRFEDVDEAEAAARSFIAFCRGRAWVFSDTGTTKEGENLYQFTHRTFLEYFAASHLARIHPTPAQLGPILLPRIAKREWDMVSLLSFQLQNRNVEGAADELLHLVLSQTKASQEPGCSNSLSFAARALESLVPRPSITREISVEISRRMFGDSPESSVGNTAGSDPEDPKHAPNVGEIFSDLLNASEENRGPITAVIESIIYDKFESGNTHEKAVAFELGTYVSVFTLLSVTRRPSDQSRAYWASVSEKFRTTNRQSILSRCKSNASAALWGHIADLFSFAEIVRWHGPAILFVARRTIAPPHVTFAPLADNIIHSALVSEGDEPHRYKTLIDDLADVLGSIAPPWHGRFRAGLFDDHLYTRHVAGRATNQRRVSPKELFAAAILTAAGYDRADDPAISQLGPLKNIESPAGLVARMILARNAKIDPSSVGRELEELNLEPNHQQLFRDWINQKIHLTTANRLEVGPRPTQPATTAE
jgi:hypothetical protein